MARSSYIESYDDISVHEVMLKDQSRTLAYLTFMQQNKKHFEGKVVMDVGSGTGILAMFAAKAGAKKVYAVEASDMHHLSEKIIKGNKLEGVVTVMGQRVEEVQLQEKVDVIVSEWMGFYLLHESMLASVLVARDRFLKEDGVMLPSTATILAAPTSLHSLHSNLHSTWKDVYGFDFSAVADELMQTRLHRQPLIDLIPSQDLLSAPHTVAMVDLRYADAADLECIHARLKFQFEQHAVFRGVTLWFDVHFSVADADDDTDARGDSAEGPTKTPRHCTLSTSPSSSPTHWKQTTILLPTPLLVSKGNFFECSLTLQRGGDDDDPERRRYKIILDLQEDDDGDDDDDDDSSLPNGDSIDQQAFDLIVEALNK